MLVVVAPDTFRGSLTAPEAALAMAAGIRAALPAAEVRLLPVSDGGEGFVEAAVAAGAGFRGCTCAAGAGARCWTRRGRRRRAPHPPDGGGRARHDGRRQRGLTGPLDTLACTPPCTEGHA